MEDVSLTFDNKMFLKGLEEISKKLGSLVGATEKSTEKISKGVSISAMSFLKINAALSFAKMGISKLMANIPEIGQTFKIAGDIITRNFLWPLRQQLMPYLQKFLNWVRDHRAMFVRWGAILVNVFQVVVQGIKAAINILKPFYDAAMKFFKNLFGSTADSIDKIMNIIVFKIAAIIIYLEAILKPVMESIANIMLKIAESTVSFAEGFAKAAMNIGNTWPMIKGLVKDLELLADALFGSGEGWKTLGEILGYTIIPFLDGLLLLLRGVVKALTAAAAFGGAIGSMLTGDKKGMGKKLDIVSQTFGMDTAEVANKKIEERQADLELQEKARERIAGKVLKEQINTSFNIQNVNLTANSEAEGKAGMIGFEKQARELYNNGKAVRGH